MAKLTCAKSGVVFSVEHMPVSLTSREIDHPLFTLPPKKLLSLYGRWSKGNEDGLGLTHTESYLLYLALFNSTGLVIWRNPAVYHSQTPQIIANNMKSLIHIIGKIDVIQHPSFTLPTFAVTSDTASLENSYHWIESWVENYNDWYQSLKDSNRAEDLKTRINQREEALNKLIKTPHASPESKANMLASWAELAGNFPQYKETIDHPFKKGQKLNIAEYWKSIIRACVCDDQIWKYPKTDLEELIDHCEDNIRNESIRSFELFKLLNDAKRKQTDYLGFGDVDLAGRTTSFQILNPTQSAEDANKIAAIQSAPESEPRESNYPNKFSFMRAKANWDMAQRYIKNGNML